MRHMLSVLFMFILVVSHGSVSAALPHADDASHHLGFIDAHDHDATGVEVASDPADTEGETTQSAAHHSHQIADAVPAIAAHVPFAWVKKARHVPADDAPLLSAALDSIPEPPSA